MKSSWLVPCLVLIACNRSSGSARYENLDPGGEPLVAAFNAAEGKVRAIFLASPT